jgi:hypothetical protein
VCRSLSPSDSGPGSRRLIWNISSPTSAGMLRQLALTRTSRLGVTPVSLAVPLARLILGLVTRTAAALAQPGPVVPPCHGRRPEGASAATVTVPAAPGRPGGSGRTTVTVTVTDSDRACQAAAESQTVTVRHRTRSVRVGRESRSESAAADRRRGYSDPGPASRVTDALTVTSGRRR